MRKRSTPTATVGSDTKRLALPAASVSRPKPNTRVGMIDKRERDQRSILGDEHPNSHARRPFAWVPCWGRGDEDERPV